MKIDVLNRGWALRVIVLLNFSLVIVAFRLPPPRFFLADAIVLLCQLWFVLSTLLLPVLFAYALRRRIKQKGLPKAPATPLIVDGLLVFIWWAALLALCYYAVMATFPL
jgi:hypothetical protein